jgi:hypothetical protein
MELAQKYVWVTRVPNVSVEADGTMLYIQQVPL